MGLVGRSAERKVAFAGRFVAASSLPISAASASPVGSERSREMKWVSSSDFVGREPESGSMAERSLPTQAFNFLTSCHVSLCTAFLLWARGVDGQLLHAWPLLSGAFLLEESPGCSPRRR